MKQKLKTCVHGDIKYNLEGPVDQVIAYLTSLKELQDGEVILEVDNYYDGYSIEVYTTRLETDEEEEARIKRELERRLRVEERERQQLAELQAKYQGKGS